MKQVLTSQTPQQPRFPSSAWWVSFVVFGLGYMLFRDVMPQQWGWIIKIAPILLLLQLTLVWTRGKLRTLLASALVLSATGDVLLSMDGVFVPGLGAFLLAQLTYTGLFLTQCRWRLQRLPWAALIVFYTLSCSLFILPRTGDLQAVTTAYMIAISLMALSAGFRVDQQFLWVAVGALVFMVSDTLIAIDTFISPFAYADAAIMATYYTAQALICVGMIQHARKRSGDTS